MNQNININIHHKDWNDNLSLDIDNNIIKRMNNNDEGKFILTDSFLLIIWEKWEKEYFYTRDNILYYHISDKNYFDLDNDHSIIYLIGNDSDKYIIDYNVQKIYNMNRLEHYGNYIMDKNNLIITHNEKTMNYIYFNHKYYQESLLNNKYDIIENNYFLDKTSNICYENNMYNKYYYIKYKNNVKIYDEYDKNIYINYTSDYKDDYLSYKLVSDLDMNSIDNYILILNENIFDSIHIIEYYVYFNIDYIIFDNIIHMHKNDIFKDLNIYYYHNIDELSNVKNICININNENFIENSTINIKDIWYNINKDKLDKYKYILEKQCDEIPKIMHFIWLGNNKLPDIYIYYIKSWIKNHRDWIFCFWNDTNIPNLINQKYYDKTDVYAMKSDILRYELLYIFGGVYVDCDFLCIQNIESIIKNYKGFSGYESDEYIAIGLMGFVPYDIILYNIIKRLSYHINHNSGKSIPELSGPVFFTKIWNIYNTNAHYSFPIHFFYSYTFQDKIKNIQYNIHKNNYAIHMWGHSWSNNYINNITNEYYLTPLYFSYLNIECQKINTNISKYLQSNIYFYVNKSNKKKIVHVMGLFFTGGIERYLYYIDKYGDHNKYCYYLLYISNGTYVYEMKNMIMISFDWNNSYLNKLLTYIQPDLIIDHYSIYIKEYIYNNIDKNKIIYFIHSAICYNNDIDFLCMNKCIHLYNEINKHLSWNTILNNYYLTLGTELHVNKIEKYNENNKIKISIIGRVAEEKLGIVFFKKLCDLSFQIYESIEINIYGEKDKIFNNMYSDEFDENLQKSKIIYHEFMHPLNMKTVYMNTNILLIPSSYETGSFTCIEAFSYGIPVIARNVYGLKYLIKNNITGYLCDSDNEIFEKIIHIQNDTILNNNDIIKDASLKYNIINKIQDLESIIEENITNKNIVIITSVINCIDKPLSYYPKRSIFNINDRYKQTLKSIDSIKKNIKNVDILFCECSDLTDYNMMEEDIKNKVDYYYNFYNNENIRNNVESEFKGLGEASILLEALNKITNNYENIFKLSGRYYLNSDFNYEIFNNTYNIFTTWDNSDISYCTIFYKIHIEYIEYYQNILKNMFNDLKNDISIESCMYKYFIENVEIINKVNVSGLLATEGYIFTV